MSTEKKPQATLKRQLNPINVWAIAFGCIIGWGSFINPGKKFLPNSGVAGTAIAMLLGVKKAGFIQTVLATLLAVCAFTLCISAILSPKANMVNMQPVWGFYKKEAMAAGATAANIGEFAHKGTGGIFSAVLATFTIAPWAFVGFDTIPQAAEEFKFSYKKVMLIMGVAIAFGCFVYASNNAVVTWQSVGGSALRLS